MSLPHLLLVDDSEAILAFEKAALTGHYLVSTADNGKEALEKIPQLRPAAVLLDLSMPQMDGDEVFAHMRKDEEMRRVPVIIISSEKVRAEACVKAGAKAFLPKPIRADELLLLVGRVLDEARKEQRQGSLAVLFVGVGTLEVGLPLDCVHSVLHQPATRPLPVGPAYLSEMFELRGQPVCVLDLARRLGLPHGEAIAQRKLVVVEHGGLRIALCVDRVRDPEEVAPADVTPRERLGGAEHGPLSETLVAMARTSRGQLPVIDPYALLSRKLLRELPGMLREATPGGQTAPGESGT